MLFSTVKVCREAISGTGPEGRFRQGDVLPMLAQLVEE